MISYATVVERSYNIAITFVAVEFWKHEWLHFILFSLLAKGNVETWITVFNFHHE